jgi:hypothetical protein
MKEMADGVGFEPTRRFHACWFSRPVPSTTRPPVRRRTLQFFHLLIDQNAPDGHRWSRYLQAAVLSVPVLFRKCK